MLLYIRYCLINRIHFELSVRVLLIIIDNYSEAIASSKKLSKLLAEIQKLVRKNLTREIDMLGYGLAGLKLMRKELGFLKEEKIELPYFQ